MTGGGVLTVRDGRARYVNPNAVRELVRASDLGQQYSEDALKIAFGQRIDADDLSFKEASGAFAIVAGAVRLKNLAIKADGLAANGNAVVDLNAMTLDSDWALTFDPVDNKVQGIDPKAGLVFRGPLAAPSRSIDVLPFAAYLNEREAARMNEIIALDQATRAEKQRLGWLASYLSEDAAWRAEQARIAAEREAERRAAAIAQAMTLELFHVNREVRVEQGRVAALSALAERMAGRQADADAIAAEAAKVAKTERARADAAAKTLAAAVSAEAAAKAQAQAAAQSDGCGEGRRLVRRCRGRETGAGGGRGGSGRSARRRPPRPRPRARRQGRQRQGGCGRRAQGCDGAGEDCRRCCRQGGACRRCRR